MYLKDDIEPSRLVPRAECAVEPEDRTFSAICSRFYQNCAASRGQKTAAPVQNLRNESIRMVMKENKDAIISGTFYPPIGEWNVAGVTDMSIQPASCEVGHA